MSQAVLTEILNARVVAIVRQPDGASGLALARELLAGGVRVLEVSLTTPGALDAIRQLRAGSDAVIGAGTVLRPEMVAAVVEAGAQFMVTPSLNVDVLREALDAKLVVGPGVFTATECASALDHGAHLLKLFPAQILGIAGMKALSDPFPEAKWLPTGGMTIDNAVDWLAAGASAVGIGSGLTGGGADEARMRAAHLMDKLSQHDDEKDG
jgi:2-dehydro-3-deoxyphosphogluconate aldolase/(4S)-4-hydroxy-2-oxoglutarate aldolase